MAIEGQLIITRVQQTIKHSCRDICSVIFTVSQAQCLEPELQQCIVLNHQCGNQSIAAKSKEFSPNDTNQR
jgi:hypothetical protein